ncbi:MAG TPA: RidA family protein [Candidatus Limnocylindria bacterium]|nr:RidA family protein [Candidatus Limnocylindria bacterium]
MAGSTVGQAWKKIIVTTEGAPAPRSAASAQGVRVGPLLFVTGQSGREPGEAGYKANPVEHARRTMENVKAVVEAGGSTMADVVKRTVIVRDQEIFAAVRDVIESYFPTPVASTTLRGALMLPDMLLEVEVVAVVPE